MLISDYIWHIWEFFTHSCVDLNNVLIRFTSLFDIFTYLSVNFSPVKKNRHKEIGKKLARMNINRWFFIGDSFTPSPALTLAFVLWWFLCFGYRFYCECTYKRIYIDCIFDHVLCGNVTALWCTFATFIHLFICTYLLLLFFFFARSQTYNYLNLFSLISAHCWEIPFSTTIRTR